MARGEEDAPRVSADFLRRQMPQMGPKVPTRSARQVGVSAAGTIGHPLEAEANRRRKLSTNEVPMILTEEQLAI